MPTLTEESTVQYFTVIASEAWQSGSLRGAAPLLKKSMPSPLTGEGRVRVINISKLERRKLKGFDYTVSAAPDTKNFRSPGQLRRRISPNDGISNRKTFCLVTKQRIV